MSAKNNYSQITWILIIAFSIFATLKVAFFRKISINASEPKEIKDTTLVVEQPFADSINKKFHNGIDSTRQIDQPDVIVEEIHNFYGKRHYYKGKNFFINISGEIQVYGATKLLVTKNGWEIVNDEISLWMGNIQDFKIQERFCFFAAPIAGGTDGKFYIEYYCIDFEDEQMYKVVYDCDESYSDCGFEDLSLIEKKSDVYNFMLANMRIPQKNDNYFNLESDNYLSE